ncbi:hypothetical protein PHLGIDRAFT_314519 [Phlebiopsis gigantea 11061_1 CR5-6]|uniref:Uncharacterized protein n=1 Tax=Phlebiopsis gigantea (strain 11061_1 CR5-6) TaxID=745531 RepID=A0A0C3RZR5_PHLG1|nr:hypothetical protein PHLGIDRAFT_314519 [Phlebiopsis gigantea 11061_1 CR5-6]
MLGGNFEKPPLCRNAQLASYCVTLVTTGVATLMVWYKTWQYRRTVGKLLWLPKQAQTSRVEKTMRVVIESGVLYFLFFLHAVIEDSTSVGRLEASTPGLMFSSTIWIYMTSHIVSIYPVGVIILVHTTYSMSAAATEAVSSVGFAGSGGRRVSIGGRPLEVSVRTTVGTYGDAIPLDDVARKAKRLEAAEEEEGGV